MRQQQADLGGSSQGTRISLQDKDQGMNPRLTRFCLAGSIEIWTFCRYHSLQITQECRSVPQLADTISGHGGTHAIELERTNPSPHRQDGVPARSSPVRCHRPLEAEAALATIRAHSTHVNGVARLTEVRREAQGRASRLAALVKRSASAPRRLRPRLRSWSTSNGHGLACEAPAGYTLASANDSRRADWTDSFGNPSLHQLC